MISPLEFYWRKYVNISNADSEWAQAIWPFPLEEGRLNQDLGVQRVHATEIRLIWFAVLYIEGGIIPFCFPSNDLKKGLPPGFCRLISPPLPMCNCCQALPCCYGCLSSCLWWSRRLLYFSERDTGANRKQDYIRSAFDPWKSVLRCSKKYRGDTNSKGSQQECVLNINVSVGHTDLQIECYHEVQHCFWLVAGSWLQEEFCQIFTQLQKEL